MITFDPSVATLVINLTTLLVLIGGGVFWLGKLGNRVGQLEGRFDQLDKKVDQLPDELREEMRVLRAELREEIRRGNQQLLLALANHPHGTDGQPIFRVPVSPE